MNFTYLFLEEAQQEYEAALDWYLERSISAAGNFVIAIDNALILMCGNPWRWRNEYADYYELNVKKYPFSIIYHIDEKQHVVIITSVYHRSRNPQDKYRS